MFEIVHCPFMPIKRGNFRCTVLGSPLAVPDIVKENMFLWDEAVAAGGKVLYDRPRYYFRGIAFAGGDAVDHSVILHDYKTFFVANALMSKVDAQSKKLIMNTLGVEGVAVLTETADGQLICGIKGSRTVQGGGMLHVLPTGGFVPVEGCPPDPFVSASQQMLDEIGIEVDPYSFRYVGIVRDTEVSWNPTLVFMTKLGVDFSHVKGLIPKDKWETKKLVGIPIRCLANPETAVCLDAKWMPSSLGMISLFRSFWGRIS